jgi:hypothetical protein
VFGESPNRMYCARNTAAQTITESVIRRRDEYQCCHRRAGAATCVGAEGAATGVRPIRLGSGLESGPESEEVTGSVSLPMGAPRVMSPHKSMAMLEVLPTGRVEIGLEAITHQLLART